MSYLDTKGYLAKLLATENLIVQHCGAATTASFNTATRVLTLPLIQTNSEFVYDMFIGHEVGHALYTPADWADKVDKDIPFDFINVIEDVRIERMIQDKFPGLRRDFSRGYDELNDKDFFELADKDVDLMNFIDRINLHFKLGHRALIKFTDEELVYVRAVEDADTFDKVVLVAKMLADYVQAQPQDQETQNTQEEESPGESEDKGEEQDDSKTDQKDEELRNENGPPSSEDNTNPLKSETQESFDENMKNLAQELNHSRVQYITTPTDHTLKAFPIEFLREDFESMRELELGSQSIIDDRCRQYLTSIKRDVSFMAQQFEMRKSADAYARQRVHKTGVLNTNKLHEYKLTEDLFLRQTITPDGKNHGLLMLVDWSGSMSDCIVETVKQLLVLVQFCRKVSIPFDVYTFTSQNYRAALEEGADEKPKYEVTTGGSQIVHILTSKANNRQMERDMLNLFSTATKISSSYVRCVGSAYLTMGGTPLNNVLFQVPAMVQRLRDTTNAQKISFVCLTDGESTPIFYHDNDYNTWSGVSMVHPYGKLLLRDGHHVYELALDMKQTGSIVKYLERKMPDVSFTHIYLGGPKACSRYYRQITGYMKELDLKDYKAHGSTVHKTDGWPLVALVNPRSFGDPSDEIDVQAGAKKGAIRSALRKMLKTKQSSKVVLTQLVENFS